MTLRITWSPRALKDLDGLEHPIAERVLRALDRYAEEEHGNIRKLRGREDESRLRVGEWRVLLRVEREASNLYVLRIRHRREAYRRR